MSLLHPVPDSVDELVCSARRCRQAPAWGLLWNNPKLHTPHRRKVWLACDEHRGQLEEYLGVRDFLRSTVPVEDLPRVVDGAQDADEPAGPSAGGAHP